MSEEQLWNQARGQSVTQCSAPRPRVPSRDDGLSVGNVHVGSVASPASSYRTKSDMLAEMSTLYWQRAVDSHSVWSCDNLVDLDVTLPWRPLVQEEAGTGSNRWCIRCIFKISKDNTLQYIWFFFMNICVCLSKWTNHQSCKFWRVSLFPPSKNIFMFGHVETAASQVLLTRLLLSPCAVGQWHVKRERPPVWIPFNSVGFLWFSTTKGVFPLGGSQCFYDDNDWEAGSN